jgi:hypothetical protein
VSDTPPDPWPTEAATDLPDDRPEEVGAMSEMSEIPEVPEAPETGDEAVDEAVRALARALGDSLEEQVAAYESAHRVLAGRLADVEG